MSAHGRWMKPSDRGCCPPKQRVERERGKGRRPKAEPACQEWEEEEPPPEGRKMSGEA